MPKKDVSIFSLSADFHFLRSCHICRLQYTPYSLYSTRTCLEARRTYYNVLNVKQSEVDELGKKYAHVAAWKHWFVSIIFPKSFVRECPVGRDKIRILVGRPREMQLCNSRHMLARISVCPQFQACQGRIRQLLPAKLNCPFERWLNKCIPGPVSTHLLRVRADHIQMDCCSHQLFSNGIGRR